MRREPVSPVSECTRETREKRRREKRKNNDAEKRKRKALRNRRRGFCISQRTKHIFRVFFRMTDGKRLTYVMSLEMWLLYDPSIVRKSRKGSQEQLRK